MNRRQFTHLGAAALAALPLSCTAMKIPAYRPATDGLVGHGDFRYKVHHDWQQRRDLPVKDCHEMVQVPDGRLFLLTNHTANNVVIYDRSGKVLDTWGDRYPGAHGLSLAMEGETPFLWITDEKRHQVYKCTLDGRELLTLDWPKESGYYTSAEEYKPTETTMAPDGSIYVADGYGKCYVHRYSAAGEYMESFGGKGEGPALFDCNHGVTLDTRTLEPTLLVTSRTKQEFKRFTLDGRHLETYPTPGMWICRPVIQGDHTYFAVIVTDTWYSYDGFVAILDKNMRLVSAPGASAPTYADGKLTTPKSDELTFMNPHDVCVDADENLYVPQWYSGRTYPVMLERV